MVIVILLIWWVTWNMGIENESMKTPKPRPAYLNLKIWGTFKYLNFWIFEINKVFDELSKF